MAPVLENKRGTARINGGVIMPRGDGTGPVRGAGIRGGRMAGSRSGAGPGGNCVCPNCGEKVSHTQGTPCYGLSCPKCGTKMIRG